MRIEVNGARLFFDVEGLKLVSDGATMREQSTLILIHGAPGFTDQAKVMNGASDLLAQIFGEKGRHARTSVGVSELPQDIAVEVDLVLACTS